MLQFSRFFSKSFHSTLNLLNGTNFSYKPQWTAVTPNVVLDQWWVADFMAAEYTIVIDAGTLNKEIIKCLVVAGPDSAKVTVYGRTNLIADLVDITAEVDSSRLRLILNSNTSGCKAIFSANYYHTINRLEV